MYTTHLFPENLIYELIQHRTHITHLLQHYLFIDSHKKKEAWVDQSLQYYRKYATDLSIRTLPKTEYSRFKDCIRLPFIKYTLVT